MKKTQLAIGVIAALAMTATAATLPAQSSHRATTAATAATATTHSSARAAALDDPAIVGIFDAANTWDIDLGRLALKKSSNKEVRNFADMMVRDHTAVRKLGRELATKLKVTPTPPAKDFALYKDYVATTAKLNGLKGAAFDKAYMDHEAWYHQTVIDAMTNTLMPATQNAELKALEVKVAPNFQAHLVAAKDLAAKLSK